MRELPIPPDPSRIREYLLRKLPEAERARFEEAYFADDSLLDKVEAEEDVLVSDYVLGKLHESDRRRFEESLLDSPYYRERVQTTTRLKRRIQRDKAFRPNAVRLPGLGRRGRDTTGKIFPGRTGTIVAFALLSALLVAAFVSALRLKGQLEEARSQVGDRPVTPPSAMAVQTVILDGTEAGAPGARRIFRNRGASLLLVFPRRLLPPGERSFEMKVLGPTGTTVWDSGPHPLSPSEAEGDATFRLPRGVPPAGRFSIQLAGASGATWSANVEVADPPSPSLPPAE